ncbi:MAG: excinuclease ABC subunit UvrC [Patescibacteria group bacterium]|nr:excinuclease ABC subunit UvrC [Patescibacteria group bacterium]MDD5715808.1 excinuclease ABC subunit UvrC [Patescibacteria group bacterium]
MDKHNKATINLTLVPRKPGVYIFKNEKGEILYIGKAKLLKSRVSSYFHKSAQLAPGKQLMIPKIVKMEFIITSSEAEALLLESTLIKKHQPPYNVDLKDDKNFQYIKITTGEEFPRVFTVRRIERDKAKYFGPYVSGLSVRRTLRFLRKLFPHRSFTRAPQSHQLRYLVKRYQKLIGPADPREYRKTIDRIISFLNGNYQGIVNELQRGMEERSREQKFEQAAALRDKIQAIERIMERQKVVSAKPEDQDILNIAREGSRAAVSVFTVRAGKLIGQQNFLLTNTEGQGDAELMQTFIERYYSQHANVPDTLIVPAKLPNMPLIQKTFGLTVLVPQRGIKKRYLAMGFENARHYVLLQKASWERTEHAIQNALNQFQKTLRLPSAPHRIEAFDISNIQGTNPVGSMVVFTDGKPDKKWYRKFKITSVRGANDPAMMAEVISRRFKHITAEGQTPRAKKKHPTADWPKPDLVILDGGMGQLNAALKVLRFALPLIALAKQEESIYVPGRKLPIRFPAQSDALFLIQRIRDEAHRFAITFYRKTHGSGLQRSVLDEIPGVGPATRKKLIRTFGSVRGVRSASPDELKAAVGTRIAQQLSRSL